MRASRHAFVCRIGQIAYCDHYQRTITIRSIDPISIGLRDIHVTLQMTYVSLITHVALIEYIKDAIMTVPVLYAEVAMSVRDLFSGFDILEMPQIPRKAVVLYYTRTVR